MTPTVKAPAEPISETLVLIDQEIDKVNLFIDEGRNCLRMAHNLLGELKRERARVRKEEKRRVKQ